MKLGRVKHIHFVGIGGAGMSGIARILLDLGYRVSGSDARDSAVVERLRAAGAQIAIGHNASNIGAAQVLVRSTAVPEDNVEVQAARRSHIPVIHRAEMLAELMRLKQGIAVAGAHGKTTTTSLTAHILEHAGLDPTVVIGGKIKGSDGGGRLGRGDVLVAEADESDGSFLKLRPVIGVLLNLDAEHMDYWGDMQKLRDGVVAFANSVPFYGAVVLCQDDDELATLRTQIRRPVRTFGTERAADFEARILGSDATGVRYRLRALGQDYGEFHLPLVGEHNVRNALAATAVAFEVGIDCEAVRAALATFPGIERRFEILTEQGPIIVDDYGHHPAELLATFAAARGRWDRPLWVVFQPHRYTRTAHLWEQFRAALLVPDHVRVTDVYAAGETPIAGIDGERLADAVNASGHPDAAYVPFADLPDCLRAVIPNDAVVLFMGAGSITAKAHEYAAKLA